MTRKGKVQLQSEINTNLANNTSRDISAQDVRDVVTNITDSMIFPGSGVVADFASSEIWPVANGGTGSSSASGARTNLGLVISTNVQAYDAQLDTFAALTANQVGGLVDLATLEAPASDGQFIVATGAGVFAYESTSTARTSLGLGTVSTLDTGISNTNVAKFNANVVDNDFLRVDGTAIEGRSASEVLTDIAAAPAAGNSSILTVGALAAGSIASGFGNITTTGTIDISGGTLTVAADGISGDKIHGGTISGNVALGDGATATTQSSSNNSTKIATTAYADAAGGGGGSSRSVAGDTGNGIITWVTGDNTFAAEANFTYDGTDAIITSATSAKPILTIQNTNDDATSGTIKFNKNTGDSAAAADVLGNIDFAGEDADENAHTYARILAKTDDPTSGGEEGSIEFHVAENDGTLTKGLDIVGLGSDGNITVDISTHDGAAGGLKLGGTLVTSTATEINVLDALTRGSLVYGNASAATAELAVGAANRALTTDGTDVSWTTITNAMLAGSIDLAAKVTGTLPVGNGGTGLTSISTLLNSNVTPTSLSLLIGTNTQAYDAQLDTLAALTANQVGGLVDLATLEAPASDGQFIVATGAGVFAYESGATARTSLGVDAAGADNSTNVTLVTSSHDYLSISTQAITLGAIDLAADVTGTLPVGSVSTITLGTNTAGNYVATVTGGTGITSTGATSGEGIAHSLSVDASQTGITAVGTLVGLTLDGDKAITPGDGSMIHLDTSTLTADTAGSGTAAKFASVAFEAPTLAATNASVTTTDATTVYISAAPSAGTNQTLTRSWALWIDAGNLRYDGSVYAGTTEALNSSGLVTVANQSNITGVSTITSGVWNGTAIALAYGGTGLVGATDGKIVVADGSGAPVAVQALTANDGYIKHEVGGIEADISAVAIGDILAGTGTGAIGIVTSTGHSDGDVLTLQADGTADWESAGGGSSRSVAGDTANGIVTWVTGDNTFAVESTFTFDGTDATLTSSSASKPIFHITNTHDGTTSGELRFNKDSTGDDSDVMGLISFYGTDSSDNTHERLAYMDAIITDSAHGSEASSLRFYVAENDATLTQGLLIAGQADDDGEVDVTIGAGAASTTIIAGTLTMGSTAALTNAGLVAVANQSNITGTGALSSGSITSGFGAIDNGSSNITTTGTLDISGGTLTLAANQISGDKVEGGTIAATIITALTTAGITATANIDIGAYDLRAATVTADGLTSGRVVFAGTAGVLSSDADLTFSGDTLTATKLKVSDGGTIGSATDADVITIAAEGDVTFSKATKPAAPAAASGTSGIVVLDCNTTNHFTITTSGNITGWNFTNASPGQRIIVRVTNGASHTVAFAATGDGDVVYFPGGTEPVLTTSSGIDVYGFLCVAADTFDGFIIGQDIKA